MASWDRMILVYGGQINDGDLDKERDYGRDEKRGRKRGESEVKEK